MLWLDGVLSVPTIGIRIKPDYKDISSFQQRATDVIGFLSGEFESLKVSAKDVWGYSVSPSKTGFFFVLIPTNIVVGYKYGIVSKPQPGGLPTLETPEIQPYSDVLEETYSYTRKVLELIDARRGFTCDRIGIVCDVSLDADSQPPGVTNWIEDLGKPLEGDLLFSKVQLLTKLSEQENYHDQCHHIINFDSYVPEKGLEFRLDWQRLFTEPIQFEPRRILTSMNDCKEKAIEYFEGFGQGGVNDG